MGAGAINQIYCTSTRALLSQHTPDLNHSTSFGFQKNSHPENNEITCPNMLAQVKKQGLGISLLDTLFKAIVLNKILYALPVYYGYLTEGQKGVLQRV